MDISRASGACIPSSSSVNIQSSSEPVSSVVPLPLPNVGGIFDNVAPIKNSNDEAWNDFIEFYRNADPETQWTIIEQILSQMATTNDGNYQNDEDDDDDDDEVVPNEN
jgi:hypothetical protein